MDFLGLILLQKTNSGLSHGSGPFQFLPAFLSLRGAAWGKAGGAGPALVGMLLIYSCREGTGPRSVPSSQASLRRKGRFGSTFWIVL